MAIKQASQVSEFEGRSRCQEHMLRQEACDLHDGNRHRSKDVDDNIEVEKEEVAKGRMSYPPWNCLNLPLLKV